MDVGEVEIEHVDAVERVVKVVGEGRGVEAERREILDLVANERDDSVEVKVATEVDAGVEFTNEAMDEVAGMVEAADTEANALIVGAEARCEFGQ
ncbi:hypothetical protein ABT299_30305 [Spirillospora sp. NPDC000708]